MTANEVERRKPVWSALSEFYLDTELSKEEISRIAKVFIDSRYSLEELKEINYSEVGTVVYTNLYITGGVWNGFEEEWLYEQIIGRLNKKNGKGLIKEMFKPIYRKQIDKVCGNYWQAVTTEMEKHEI